MPDDEAILTDDAEVLSAGDVAKRFRVSVVTVGNWAGQGKLPFFRTPGGHRRFHRVDVEALVEASKPVANEAAS